MKPTQPTPSSLAAPCGPRGRTRRASLLPSLFPVLTLLGAPACTRTTPGYCTIDDECGRDQYCALPAAQCTDAIVLRAVLTGDQVVPPTASLASGDLTIIVNQARTSSRYTLNLGFAPPATTSTAIRAEILGGLVGQPSQNAVPLAAIGIGTLPATGNLELTPDFLTGLRAGQFYVRVTSNAFPTTGEIRGQIFSLHPEDALTTPVRLTGILTGQQESPANPSPGVGTATADFTESTSQLTVRYKISGISADINGLHVHRGGYNVNGDQIFFLPTPGPMDLQATFTVGPEKLNPGMERLAGPHIKSGVSYLNMHSANFAAGELRAQLLPTTALPFTVPLKTATGATSAGATGEVEFYWSADQSKLAYRLAHSVVQPKGVMIVRTTATPMTLSCAALTASAGVDGAQGYCDVDPKTAVAGTTPTITAGDLNLGMLNVVITSQANPTGELAGQITVPKST